MKESPSHHSPTWVREPVGSGLEILYRCNAVLYSGRSRYQRIDIVDSETHGRMLFLDSICQSSEYDEFIYHEMLVHPALFSVAEPQSVLVIGGATGASLREIFRHPGIRRVVKVDIDGELVEICKRFLPSWHRESFSDARLELIVQDGREYLERVTETFDSIILDLSDPYEGSPAALLFTKEFYQLVQRRLRGGGSVSLQAQGISPEEVALHARIANTLSSVFPVVRTCPYTLHSFHRPDAHILASTDTRWSLDELVKRVEKTPMPCRYFSAEIARGMFNLPPYLYEAYRNHTQILTDELVVSPRG